MLPRLIRRAPWFAFIVHPRGPADLYRLRAGSFLQRYSAGEEDFCAKVCSLPPVVIADITFGFGPVRGELVGAMRMPDDILTGGGARVVAESVALATERGANVVGLGALTSPATAGGRTLLDGIRRGVTITNGNAYTAAVVYHNVVEAANMLGLGTRARVAVVGCTGSVGVATSHLLAEAGFRPLLVGRSLERAREVFGTTDRASISGDIASVKGAEVIVLLTNHASARLTPGHVEKGTVVIDCAQPANVPETEHGAFVDAEVQIATGGMVRIPEYSCTYNWLGLADPRETFACLAETYMFAKEGIREHSVGRPSANRARGLADLASKYGIHPVSLKLRSGAARV